MFRLGFRPFFLGAGVFAAATGALWACVYLLQAPLQFDGLSSFQWHAHEMIYGYALAVITGFLLTAVNNWTGIRTLRGAPLAGLFACWAAARVLYFFGTGFLYAAAILDLLFAVGVCVAVFSPVLRTRQWRQLVVLSAPLLLTFANTCFYLGYAGYLSNGIYIGVYLGLYLVVALILVMGARIVPAFIERGVGYRVELRKSHRIDLAILVLYIAFASMQLLFPGKPYGGYIAFALLVVNTFRLVGWHTPGIWRAPLLWSLYASMWLVNAGFLMATLSALAGVSIYLAVHTFAFGGIGLVTVAMMTRVTLGHTGRDVNDPPAATSYCFIALLLGFGFRVVFPWLAPDGYATWIGLSLLLWTGVFVLFIVVYGPMLLRPRHDGRPG